MAASAIGNASNPPATAPEAQIDPQARAAAIASANKTAALAVLAFGAMIIVVACLTMPFPAAFAVSALTAAVALSAAAALACDCRADYAVVDPCPPHTYFYHRWFLDPIYVDPYYRAPVVVHRPVYVGPNYPQPHVAVGGGHNWFPRSVPHVRPQQHVPVGGRSRPISSLRETPPIRVQNGGGGVFGGGGHRSLPVARGAGGHTVVGGRRG